MTQWAQGRSVSGARVAADLGGGGGASWLPVDMGAKDEADRGAEVGCGGTGLEPQQSERSRQEDHKVKSSLCNSVTETLSQNLQIKIERGLGKAFPVKVLGSVPKTSPYGKSPT